MGTSTLNPAAVFVATLFAQVVQCAIIAFVIFSLYRTYHRNYLFQWACSWWALAAASLAGGAGLIPSLNPVSPEECARFLEKHRGEVASKRRHNPVFH